MQIVTIMVFILSAVFSAQAADRSLNQKITHLEELERKVSRECIGNSNAGNVRVTLNGTTFTCPQLIVVTNRLHDQIDNEVKELEACDQNNLNNQGNNLALTAVEAARRAGSCQQRSTDRQCSGQFACTLFVGSNPLGALIGGASRLAGNRNGCAATGFNQAQNCLANVMKGVFDSLWGLLKLIWDVGKAAVRGAAEWLGIVRRSERASSEKLMAAQQSGPGFIRRFISNPAGTMRAMAASMYNGIKEAAMSSYGCEQWSGRRFVSRCLKPMTNWNCATCQQKMQLMCGIAGFAIGEIGTALLTGGLAAGGKAIALGAGRAVRAGASGGRVSRMATQAVNSIPKGAQGLEAAATATRALARGTGRALTAIERQAVNAWRAVERSPASRAIQTAADRVSRSAAGQATRIALKPAAMYLDALESAAALGYRSVDNALAGAGGNAARNGSNVSRVADRREAPPQSRIADDDAPLEVDTPRVSNSSSTPLNNRTPASTQNNSGIVIQSSDNNVRVAAPVSGNAARNSPQVSRSAPRPSSSSPTSSRVTRSETRSEGLVVSERNPDDSLAAYLGRTPSLEEKEALLECIFDRQSSISAKKKFLYARPEIRSFYSTACRDLHANPERRNALRAEIEEYANQRLPQANARVREEISELGTKVETRNIDCGALNAVYGGAFPEQGAKCRAVKAVEDISGVYCGCGDRNKNRFNFIMKCPTDRAGFQNLQQFYDTLALPSTNGLEICGRVTIPAGKECYAGPTTVAFAGYGGGTQLLCFNKHYPDYDNSEISKVITQNGIDTNNNGRNLTVTPDRWSPFSDFNEYSDIIEEASRLCPERCSPEVIERLEQTYRSQRQALRQRFANEPEALRRIDQEDELFRPYLSDLRNGRRSSVAESQQANFERMSALNPDQRTNEARRLLNRELSDGEKSALLRAHDIGISEGRGFGTYTQADKTQKALILRRAGFSREEAQTLLDEGVAGAMPASRTAALDRYDAIRATDEAKKTVDLMRRNQDPAKINDLYRSYRQQRRTAAEGFASEAQTRLAAGDRAYSLQNTGLALENYVKAGDVDSAIAMMRSGMSQGMTKEGILRDFSRRLDLDPNSKNPEIILQRNTWARVKQELVPPVVQKPAVPKATVQTPVPQQTPPAQIAPQAPAKVETPAPSRTVANVSPREAQTLANEYRLGIKGKTRDPSMASQYYYQAAEDNFKKEMKRVKSFREDSNYLGDKNISSALNESLQGDGEVAVRMIERLATETKGGHGLNEFISEMNDFEVYRQKTPEARANMIKLIDKIEEGHKDRLYDPQRNMMRAWRSANDY